MTSKPARTSAAASKTKAAASKTKAAASKTKAAPSKTKAAAPKTKAAAPKDSAAASKNITKRIQDLGGWRGETLASIRKLIHDADPEVEEEWKWEKPSSGGTPVWSHDGGICTGEAYKQVVKLTFFRGASLPDPKKLFNSSLEGNVRRALDIREGEKLDEAAFKKLIQAAAAANSAARGGRAPAKARKAPRTRS